MSSFSALRAERRSRQAASHVTLGPSHPPPPDTTSASATAPKTAIGNGNMTDATSMDGDGGLYASLPGNLLEIRTSPSSGRGLWVKERIKRGSTVFAVRPHTTVLSTAYLPSHCTSCACPGSSGDLKRCPKCRVVHYCNEACQTADWGLHKLECSALRRWTQAAPSADVAVPGEAVRCLGRILWMRRKEGPGSVWTKEVEALQSHRSTLNPATFESHTHLAHSLVRYLGLASPSDLGEFGLSTAGDLVDLISRFTTNTITLSTSSLTPIGLMVSPPVALINHSCEPNAVVVFPSDGTLAHVIAVRDIAAGEELTTSYVDTTLPRAMRQKVLRETYNFTCACPACAKDNQAGQAVDLREAIWCPKRCGGMCPFPTEEDNLSRCSTCRKVIPDPDSVIDAIRLGQEALDKATSLQFKDPAYALRLTTNILPILTSHNVVPCAHSHLALLRLHQSLLISTASASSFGWTQLMLDDAIRTAAQTVASLRQLYAEGHPVRALALAELGKLLAVDEPVSASASASASSGSAPEDQQRFPPNGPARLRLALETMQRASAELAIGFGSAEGGNVGQEIREYAINLEQELSVWDRGVRNAREDRRAAGRALQST